MILLFGFNNVTTQLIANVYLTIISWCYSEDS